MALKEFPKGSEARLSESFEALEFDCPCRKCHTTLIDMDLIEKLERLRELAGAPLYITSGFRCRNHQDELERKGYETASLSMHLVGGAADLRTGKHTGEELEMLARAAGFLAVGVGARWIHVDLRDAKERRWVYKKR